MKALNRRVERVFNPSRNGRHWGLRKLARDRCRRCRAIAERANCSRIGFTERPHENQTLTKFRG
jgi:hypothetical protein